MDIIKHLNWPPPSIEINDGAFNIEIIEGSVDILCEWDYGWRGRGSERVSIPLDLIEAIISEYKNYA